MNSIGHLPPLQFVGSLTEVFQEWAVELLNLTGGVHGTHQARDAIDNLTKIIFAGSQLFLSASTVFDVDYEAIPAGDSAFCVSHRKSTKLEPPVNTVCPTITNFYVVRSSSCHRRRKFRCHTRKIIRVERTVVGPPPVQLLNRHAEVLGERLIRKLDLAGLIQGAHQARNAVQNLAEISFARPKGFLCDLAIVDIRSSPVPPNDFASFIV